MSSVRVCAGDADLRGDLVAECLDAGVDGTHAHGVFEAVQVEAALGADRPSGAQGVQVVRQMDEVLEAGTGPGCCRLVAVCLAGDLDRGESDVVGSCEFPACAVADEDTAGGRPPQGVEGRLVGGRGGLVSPPDLAREHDMVEPGSQGGARPQ